MLMAHYGKGLYIYTGYAFFRQLPAGGAGRNSPVREPGERRTLIKKRPKNTWPLGGTGLIPGTWTGPRLAREVGLREATALNVIDMIGVGPFITIPFISKPCTARRPCWGGS